ncbi:MAG: thiamine pyrophosphate-binding protein, partial [Thermoproteus sp.]|nr:thiamine pyrophosphate-binding protein [Thermoproteus sp.]
MSSIPLGITGGSIMALFDAAYFLDDLEVVMFRHEQGAVHAAEGYARVAGRPAVVAATSGPGATNLVTGITDAYMDSVPVVAITGQVPTWVFGRDGFQETDILGVVTPVTKWVYQVRRPEEAATAVRIAYEISSLGRPGPTLVDLPRDIQVMEARGDAAVPINAAKFVPPKPKEEDLARAAKIILEAERPVVLAGGGVLWSGATREILALAERLGAPIVSTLPGKAAIPHNHPLYMGPAGMHGRAEADAALANADVVVAVGTRFSDRTWGRFRELQEAVKSGEVKLIHIDVDRSEVGKNVRPTIGVVADAREALRRLLEILPEAAARSPKYLAWLYYIRRRYEDAMEKLSAEFRHFAPWKVLKAVRRAAPPNAVAVTGVGGHQMWAEVWWEVYEPGAFITSAGLGTMGFGIPASLGAKLADRSRPVLCIDGDGSFQMTFNNLALVREYDLPFVEIVFDNASLQLVKQWQIY